MSDLATASIGCAGLAIAQLFAARFDAAPKVVVDRRLSSIWFGLSVRPQGWRLPGLRDPLSTDYEAKDGWIRLHMNAPHHQDAALAVLRASPEKEAVARRVSDWAANDLETAIVTTGGCAATMRSIPEWKAHPQGEAVARELLLDIRVRELRPDREWRASRSRPLEGLRVLDLTRVLAGPVATRFLAGFGAEVLRIDPPGGTSQALCWRSRWENAVHAWISAIRQATRLLNNCSGMQTYWYTATGRTRWLDSVLIQINVRKFVRVWST